MAIGLVALWSNGLELNKQSVSGILTLDCQQELLVSFDPTLMNVKLSSVCGAMIQALISSYYHHSSEMSSPRNNH